MNNKKNSVKNKPIAFKKFDFILFIVAVLITISCFIFSFATKKSGTDSFSVYKNENLVLTFDYSSSVLKVEEEYKKLTEITEIESKIYIKIFTDKDKKDFNVLFVDLNEKTVKITESTCSLRKDCVHTPAIKNGSGVIICMPHGLKIIPTDSSYLPIVTG